MTELKQTVRDRLDSVHDRLLELCHRIYETPRYPSRSQGLRLTPEAYYP